jgi:hypothetical protein
MEKGQAIAVIFFAAVFVLAVVVIAFRLYLPTGRAIDNFFEGNVPDFKLVKEKCNFACGKSDECGQLRERAIQVPMMRSNYEEYCLSEENFCRAEFNVREGDKIIQKTCEELEEDGLVEKCDEIVC